MASSEACCRWRRRDHIKPRETPPRSTIDVDAVMGAGGDGWADASGVDEACGGGRGRAEQKGRLKRSVSSWRAMLLGEGGKEGWLRRRQHWGRRTHMR